MLLLFHSEDRGIQSGWASWPRSPKQEMAELGFRCYSTTEPRAPTSCVPSLVPPVLPVSVQGFVLLLRRSRNLLLSTVPPSASPIVSFCSGLYPRTHASDALPATVAFYLRGILIANTSHLPLYFGVQLFFCLDCFAAPGPYPPPRDWSSG